MADFFAFGSGGLQETAKQLFAKLKPLLDGKYTKPSGGIPKTDLAQAVQTSLDKAETALQSVPSTYRTAAAQDVIDSNKAPVILETASGAIASFDDGADGMPLKKLVVNIEPVQAGSGDPSPENVRPISGWTGCNIYQSGADTSNPTTFPVSWETEAGTVYGGTLTLNPDRTGTLVVDTGTTTIKDHSWGYNGTASVKHFYARITGSAQDYIEQKLLCSVLTAKSTPYIIAMKDNEIILSGGVIYVRCDSINSVSDLVSTLGNEMIIYPLANPSIIQLTAEQVSGILTTFYGTNNIWADCGDITVEYRADTKLYIQKINAPADGDMIADTQIASGRYFIIGNTLYKSTTVIPAGDKIIPGTNCIKTNLAEALNALNT